MRLQLIGVILLSSLLASCAARYDMGQLVGEYRFVGTGQMAALVLDSKGQYHLTMKDSKTAVDGRWKSEELGGEQIVSFERFQGNAWWPAKPERAWIWGRVRFYWNRDEGTYFERL